jgi:hypothetical protein
MRFAQAALGHKSKAVYDSYAKSADIICPPLKTYEEQTHSNTSPSPLKTIPFAA